METGTMTSNKQLQILSITYHDVPSEPTAAKGWKCELIDLKPGMKRIKTQRVPGMFGFPDLYISSFDIEIVPIRVNGPLSASVVIYRERPMSRAERNNFKRLAAEQAQLFLDRRN